MGRGNGGKKEMRKETDMFHNDERQQNRRARQAGRLREERGLKQLTDRVRSGKLVPDSNTYMMLDSINPNARKKVERARREYVKERNAKEVENARNAFRKFAEAASSGNEREMNAMNDLLQRFNIRAFIDENGHPKMGSSRMNRNPNAVSKEDIQLADAINDMIKEEDARAGSVTAQVNSFYFNLGNG